MVVLSASNRQRQVGAHGRDIKNHQGNSKPAEQMQKFWIWFGVNKKTASVTEKTRTESSPQYVCAS